MEFSIFWKFGVFQLFWKFWNMESSIFEIWISISTSWKIKFQSWFWDYEKLNHAVLLSRLLTLQRLASTLRYRFSLWDEISWAETYWLLFYVLHLRFKKKLALYVPRLIFGSPFLSEVTTISFTGECSYWTNLAFCWFRTRFCKACQILTMGSWDLIFSLNGH